MLTRRSLLHLGLSAVPTLAMGRALLAPQQQYRPTPAFFAMRDAFHRRHNASAGADPA